MKSNRQRPGGAPDGLRIRRPTERRVLPYGGDVAVARSIAAAHSRHPWTGRCRSCGDPHPCRDYRDANEVTAHASFDAGIGGRETLAAADWLVGLGIALCAVGIVGACTWRVLEALA